MRNARRAARGGPGCRAEAGAPIPLAWRGAAERRSPVGTAAPSAADGPSPPALKGRRQGNADHEKARGRLGTPTSGRHSGAQRRGRQIAVPLKGRSHGTAAHARWGSAMRNARRAARGGPGCRAEARRSNSARLERRRGAPVSDRHRPPTGGRNRVPPTTKKRGDGLERRPPVGTAARSAADSDKVRVAYLGQSSCRLTPRDPASDWSLNRETPLQTGVSTARHRFRLESLPRDPASDWSLNRETPLQTGVSTARRRFRLESQPRDPATDWSLNRKTPFQTGVSTARHRFRLESQPRDTASDWSLNRETPLQTGVSTARLRFRLESHPRDTASDWSLTHETPFQTGVSPTRLRYRLEPHSQDPGGNPPVSGRRES